MNTRSRKQFDVNEPKYRREYAEDLTNDSDDANGDLNNSSDDSEESSSTQDSSDTSDNSSSTEIDSGDESSASSFVSDTDNHEKSIGLRSNSQEQAQTLATRTFTTRSERQWTTTEPSKYQVPSANILQSETRHWKISGRDPNDAGSRSSDDNSEQGTTLEKNRWRRNSSFYWAFDSCRCAPVYE